MVLPNSSADVKGANLLVETNGRVKLTDFGRRHNSLAFRKCTDYS